MKRYDVAGYDEPITAAQAFDELVNAIQLRVVLIYVDTGESMPGLPSVPGRRDYLRSTIADEDARIAALTPIVRSACERDGDA